MTSADAVAVDCGRALEGGQRNSAMSAASSITSAPASSATVRPSTGRLSAVTATPASTALATRISSARIDRSSVRRPPAGQLAAATPRWRREPGLVYWRAGSVLSFGTMGGALLHRVRS